ncbi:MAG: hypothetical protein QXP80_03995 [Zestosphaera sp.]
MLALVYYSKTGKTKELVDFISRRLRGLGIATDVFMVKPARDYYDKLLHLNPRILYESLSSKVVSIVGDEGFEPSRYGVVVIATPIWWGVAAPPIYSFVIKYANAVKSPVYCIATADLRVDYAVKLRGVLESQGFRVRECVTVRSLKEDADRVNLLINGVASEVASLAR